MTVSLLEVLAAARVHAAPLAAESAGYLLLAATDHVAFAPRVVVPDEIELSSDGSVRLRGQRAGAGGASPELALRRLLARVLEVSSAAGPALRRASERRDEAGLNGLVRELEAALIPVNRSAAKRALSRLHRETERARDAGKLEAALQREAAVAPTPAPLSDAIAVGAEFPEATPAPALPAVVAAPLMPAPVAAVAPAPVAAVAPAPEPAVQPVKARAPAPPAPAFLSPPPLPAEEIALTKPEPVIERARVRGSSTPRLGTLVTAQSLASEDADRTERAPAVAAADELDVPIDVELEPSVEPEVTRARAAVTQPLVDPEPSRLPDVLSAMLALHVGVEADEAPTRLRDVVTELRPPAPEPEQAPEHEPEHEIVTSAPRFDALDSAVHDAVTWNPGPVELRTAPAPQPFVVPVAELQLEPSPYAPAVLPARTSDVSELLDSFYVSGGSEERELRGALKELAGLELTPMPHPLVEEG